MPKVLKWQIEVGSRKVSAIGNSDFLHHRRKLGLFCSVKCPGSLILKAFDFARLVREAGTSIVGGFHSPVEKNCQKILLRGRSPIIICLARRITAARLPREWQDGLNAGRLLLLSPFDESQKRVTANLAVERNDFVASLSDEVLILYAHPGGKTEALGLEVLATGKRVYAFNDKANEKLIEAGAVPVEPEFFAANGEHAIGH